MADTDSPVDFQAAAHEADLAAFSAYSQGAFARALTWLNTARQLDPANAGLFDQHEQRVIAAAQAQTTTPNTEPGA
jgi:hypothetical protein